MLIFLRKNTKQSKRKRKVAGKQLRKKHYRPKSIGSWTQMSLGSQELPADPLLLDRIGRVTLANLV